MKPVQLSEFHNLTHTRNPNRKINDYDYEQENEYEYEEDSDPQHLRDRLARVQDVVEHGLDDEAVAVIQ